MPVLPHFHNQHNEGGGEGFISSILWERVRTD